MRAGGEVVRVGVRATNRRRLYSIISFMQRYDFDALLSRIATMRRQDMINVAENECANAERAGAYGGDSEGFEYAQRLKEFLYWLRYGTKPHRVDDSDWVKFRPLAAHLVKTGDLKPSTLNEWPEA